MKILSFFRRLVLAAPALMPCGLLLLLVGCPFDRALTAVEEAERLFDAAINTVSHDSTRWQQALKDLSEKLPAEIQGTIRVEVTQLVQRSVAETGIEFRCNVDFLGARAIQALKEIKRRLRGGNVQILPPSFCHVLPPEINLQLAADRRERIEFSGYDMDHRDPSGLPVQLVMVNAANQTRPVPEQLVGRTTHYLLVLNSGDAALVRELASFNAAKVKMSWAGKTDGLPEVIVRQWTPARQSTRAPIGELTYTPPKLGRGDADFDTHDNEHMSVQVRADARIQGNTIQVRAFMHAREERDDWTEAGGTDAWRIAYTAPAGWRIIGASPTQSSSKNGNINHQGAVTWNLPQGELVERFVIFGDHDGDEAGTWTRVEVHFNAITVELEQLPPT